MVVRTRRVVRRVEIEDPAAVDLVDPIFEVEIPTGPVGLLAAGLVAERHPELIGLAVRPVGLGV